MLKKKSVLKTKARDRLRRCVYSTAIDHQSRRCLDCLLLFWLFAQEPESTAAAAAAENR